MSVSELIGEKNHTSWIASKKAAEVNDWCYHYELQFKTKEFASHFECDKQSSDKKFEFKMNISK